MYPLYNKYERFHVNEIQKTTVQKFKVKDTVYATTHLFLAKKKNVR